MKRYCHATLLILGAIVSLTMPISAVNAQTPLHFGWSSVTPHVADLDGDGRHELILFDSDQGTVYARRLNNANLGFGAIIAASGSTAAFADYDGDRLVDAGAYNQATGEWYVWLSTRQSQLTVLQSIIGNATTMSMAMDFDGDCKADPALYDSWLGVWLFYLSASGYQPVAFNHLAGESCQAVPEDYDGDGKADPAVYDQASGDWAVNFSGSQYALNTLTYGGPGCVAAPADFDGDGKADPTVYCAALGVWGTLHSTSNYAQALITQGGPGCVPIPASYYCTNRADYAVYNTTNGCWIIVYQPLQGIWTKLGCKFLKALVKGAGQQTGKDIAGWTLGKIFHHNEEPADPHWAEELEILTSMNSKLDDLLQGQVDIMSQINDLARQLHYEMAQVTLLLDGKLAKEACANILTHFDQDHTDSYKAFYQCNTNNLPPNSAVTMFAGNVKGAWNIVNEVTKIHTSIMPSDSDKGLLWDWAALATNGLTPDNLAGNFAALAGYYDNLYMYQMKGVTMYADACRTLDTSSWSYAQTALYVTNNVVSMIQAQVDLLREVTYTYVMTAVKAPDFNPLGTNNPMAVAGVAETLAGLEFFTRGWRGQEQSLCATILTADRPNVKFSNIVAEKSGTYYPALTVVTNRAQGLLYGYLNPDIRNIVATNGYLFVRADFGQMPLGEYRIYGYANNATQALGCVTVSNYDDEMNPTSDPMITNRFGHLYTAPFNLDRLALPLNDPAWAANATDLRTYLDGHGPSSVLHFNLSSPTSLQNFDMTLHFEYDMDRGRSLPSRLGAWPWYYLFGFPFAISNCAGLPVNAKVTIEVADANTAMKRWDTWSYNTGYGPSQKWTYSDCGGVAGFGSGNYTKWAWQPSRSEIFPQCSHGQNNPLTYTVTTNSYVGMVHTLMNSGSHTSLTFHVGSQIYLQQDCMRGGFAGIWSYASGTVQFKVKNIVVSFY